MDDASDADCMIMDQFLPPILGAFSGTTIESPGLRDALSGSPENHPPLLFFDAITDPSARITKNAFLSSSCVSRPDWLNFFFDLRAATEIYTLSLHAALPVLRAAPL